MLGEQRPVGLGRLERAGGGELAAAGRLGEACRRCCRCCCSTRSTRPGPARTCVEELGVAELLALGAAQQRREAAATRRARRPGPRATSGGARRRTTGGHRGGPAGSRRARRGGRGLGAHGPTCYGQGVPERASRASLRVARHDPPVRPAGLLPAGGRHPHLRLRQPGGVARAAGRRAAPDDPRPVRRATPSACRCPRAGGSRTGASSPRSATGRRRAGAAAAPSRRPRVRAVPLAARQLTASAAAPGRAPAPLGPRRRRRRPDPRSPSRRSPCWPAAGSDGDDAELTIGGARGVVDPALGLPRRRPGGRHPAARATACVATSGCGSSPVDLVGLPLGVVLQAAGGARSCTGRSSGCSTRRPTTSATRPASSSTRPPAAGIARAGARGRASARPSPRSCSTGACCCGPSRSGGRWPPAWSRRPWCSASPTSRASSSPPSCSSAPSPACWRPAPAGSVPRSCATWASTPGRCSCSS